MTYMQKQKDTINKRLVGSYYEEMAKDYLIKQGYDILYNNFRSRFGEIDIIARDDAYIVFIEVKYRKNTTYGYPREAVTFAKQKRIYRLAAYYMLKRYGKEVKCRFDVIEILDQQLTHIEAAF